MWAFMEGWFTPGSLFIFLNLTIGTIVLISRLSSPGKHPHHHLGSSSDSPPLARAPSLLDRVKSIDFSLYKFGHHGGRYPEPDPVQYGHSYPEHDFARRAEPPSLARSPSLLDRFKSMDFSLYRFDHPAGYPEQDPVPVRGSYPEPQFSHPVDSPPLARTPSLVDRLKSFDFDFSFNKFHAPSYAQPQADHDVHSSEQEQEHADRVEPPRLARSPSLLERVKSIDFSSFYRSSKPDSDADALHHLGVDSDSEEDDDHDDDYSVPYTDAGRARQDHQVRRIRSDSKTADPGEAAERLPAKMKKSSSERSALGHFEEEEFVERRRPQTAREGKKKSALEEEGDEIDKKADAFINRFKQHLKLQRLDSLRNYKEMLSRGAS